MQRVQFDITTACNLSCEFCYNSCGPDSHTAELEQGFVLETAANYPDAVIEIGGGEPFLHSGLASLLTELSKSHKITLATNGTMIPDWFYGLPDNVKKNIVVQVSVPASSDETFHTVCGNGSLDLVVSSLTKLQRHYGTLAHTVVYAGNAHDVKGILELCHGANVRPSIGLVLPIGRGASVELLNSEGIAKLRETILPYMAKHPVFTPLFNETSECPAFAKAYNVQKTHRPCPAEIGERLYIDAHGSISHCPFFTEVANEPASR